MTVGIGFVAVKVKTKYEVHTYIMWAKGLPVVFAGHNTQSGTPVKCDGVQIIHCVSFSFVYIVGLVAQALIFSGIKHISL